MLLAQSDIPFFTSCRICIFVQAVSANGQLQIDDSTILVSGVGGWSRGRNARRNRARCCASSVCVKRRLAEVCPKTPHALHPSAHAAAAQAAFNPRRPAHILYVHDWWQDKLNHKTPRAEVRYRHNTTSALKLLQWLDAIKWTTQSEPLFTEQGVCPDALRLTFHHHPPTGLHARYHLKHNPRTPTH